AVAGMTYPFLLPVVGTFGYQGRQLAPALCTLIALATYATVTRWKSLKWSAAFLATPLAVLWVAHVWALAGFVKDFPQNAFTTEQVAQWTAYANDTTQNDVILLSSALGSEKFFIQTYADRLILPFDDVGTIIEHAPAIQKAIGGGRVIVVTDETGEAEMKKALADAGLSGYVLIQALQP
ncbi:MAG: hypothetical protein NUW08_03040, partial [Candidatus Uhrbacteria bacterium]|nr:hypothetical protein [Candidatus Uhrbacteria bacterium]